MKQAARRTVVRLPREQRERDILDAALAIFAERGYEETSMAEIAARGGMVEGTIYKYFENKRDLLFKVMGRWYQSMLDDYAAGLDGVHGTRNRLRYMIWRHLKSIDENPALCRLFFREIRSDPNYHLSAIYEMNRRYTRFITDILRDGVEAGELRDDLPAALVRDMIYGGIEHTTWNYVCGRGELDAGAVADAQADVVFRGIAVPSAEPPSIADAAARIERAAERIERALRPRAHRSGERA
ncbi:MAG: TetR/AcrR family transcriptional regulator [Alphaproteobacteria bacterium]